MTDFSDVVTREAAWFTTDPPAGTTLTQFPALQLANGGYFDLVQPYFTKVIQRQRALFIDAEGITNDELVEWQANREVKNQIVLTIYWSFEAGTGKLEDEQQNLRNALNAVLIRVRGQIADHTHGGAFPVGVAVGGPEGDGRITLQMPKAYDQIVNREPLMATIRYIATDWLPGGV